MHRDLSLCVLEILYFGFTAFMLYYYVVYSTSTPFQVGAGYLKQLKQMKPSGSVFKYRGVASWELHSVLLLMGTARSCALYVHFLPLFSSTWTWTHDGILSALSSSPAAIFIPDLADTNASPYLPIVKLVQYPRAKAGSGLLASALSGSSSA